MSPLNGLSVRPDAKIKSSMKKFAVFCDRDGVINKEVNYLHKLEDLKILPKVSEAIKLLNQHKIPIIVITNQPAVAKGLINEKGIKGIHQEIQQFLAPQGAKIDYFLFCPHHPNANLRKYRVECDCRKPKVGLFKKAAQDYDINLKNSYIIGDTYRDIEAGKNLGCKTIAVESGHSDFRDSKPDFLVKDLFEAVKLILKREGLR